jgi:hypothetical protein
MIRRNGHTAKMKKKRNRNRVMAEYDPDLSTGELSELLILKKSTI